MEKNNMIFGGWNIDIIVAKEGNLPDKLINGFKEAFNHWVGMGFKPLVYCGSQLVNGINHMFICEGTAVVPEEIRIIAKVILHETFPTQDGSGEHFTVSSIDTLLTDMGLDGGWHIEPSFEISPEITDGIKEAKLDGAGYRPLVCCASSITSGARHFLICEGSLAIPQSNSFVASVVLNESSGEPKAWSIGEIDTILGPIFKTEGDGNSATAQIPVLKPGQSSYYHRLNKEDRAIFEKAIGGITGAGYRPLAVSTQVIDGLMRVFLCEVTVINANFERYLANVYVAQLVDGTIRLEKTVKLIEGMQE